MESDVHDGNSRVYDAVPECEASVLFGFDEPLVSRRGKTRNYIATVYLADALTGNPGVEVTEACAYYCNAKSINPDPFAPTCLSFSIHVRPLFNTTKTQACTHTPTHADVYNTHTRMRTRTHAHTHTRTRTRTSLEFSWRACKHAQQRSAVSNAST